MFLKCLHVRHGEEQASFYYVTHKTEGHEVGIHGREAVYLFYMPGTDAAVSFRHTLTKIGQFCGIDTAHHNDVHPDVQ